MPATDSEKTRAHHLTREQEAMLIPCPAGEPILHPKRHEIEGRLKAEQGQTWVNCKSPAFSGHAACAFSVHLSCG